MTGTDSDPEMNDLLHNEVAGWAPRGTPNMHDVLRRADRAWQRPVAAYSGLATAALALVLVAAVVVLLLGSHLTLTDGIRERLLAH
ncbi:MAG: hypothetical protein J2P43_07520 [Candidatus Dormibacteraeota bacterium]|nr:hypothetical protein [Candidatus Dormibacteraeota bacterium]MBO0744850.1 hypothetical protein [Candidatus Dormibacteraeota bacterium]